jgi:hypothetical protein
MDTISSTLFPIRTLNSPNQLKDSTSEFREIDTRSLNIVYQETENIVKLSEDVPSDMMIRERGYRDIVGCSSNEDILSGLNDTEKTYAIALDYVIVNESVVRGTEESRTDTLVDYILRGVGLGTYPFLLRIHPTYKFYVENKSITSVYDFGIIKNGRIIIVEEDKHMKNVGAANRWGEHQIAGELLAAACTNYSTDPIYAIRVIGTKFTFYKTSVSLQYLVSLGNGFPDMEMIIMREGRTANINDIPGLDYRDPTQRLTILKTLCGIRDCVA